MTIKPDLGFVEREREKKKTYFPTQSPLYLLCWERWTPLLSCQDAPPPHFDTPSWRNVSRLNISKGKGDILRRSARASRLHLTSPRGRGQLTPEEHKKGTAWFKVLRDQTATSQSKSPFFHLTPFSFFFFFFLQQGDPAMTVVLLAR